MQMQADLLQIPVELYPSPNATALGAAALARLGIGAAKTSQEAVGAWEPVHVYEPRIGAAQAGDRLAAWRRAAEATMDLA